MINLSLVAIGGFIGSISRYGISILFHKHPIATWFCNILGSLLLALILKWFLLESISNSIQLLIGVGFCGAFTTFSTFGNETLTFLIRKKYWQALTYVSCSVFISLVIVAFVLLY